VRGKVNRLSAFGWYAPQHGTAPNCRRPSLECGVNYPLAIERNRGMNIVRTRAQLPPIRSVGIDSPDPPLRGVHDYPSVAAHRSFLLVGIATGDPFTIATFAVHAPDVEGSASQRRIHDSPSRPHHAVMEPMHIARCDLAGAPLVDCRHDPQISKPLLPDGQQCFR